jgi:tryptophan synthase beta subunit
VAYALRLAKTLPRQARVVVGLSGRGDKDVDTVRGLSPSG